MIRGEVELDVRREDPDRDRRELWALHHLPDGVRVRVLVGSRSWLFEDSVRLLHEHGDRLEVTLVGTSCEAVARLVGAARSGVAIV